MATYTTRFNLTKPATTDTADIATINGNMDTIDGAIPAVVDNLTSTSTTSALSANQGKVLGDLVSTLSGDVADLATTADITYYVATTGSDTTGDGTSGLPFATIQHAIDLLPQIINHVVTINVASGTYAETVTISGFVGKGKLVLVGNYTTPENQLVNNFKISSCSIFVNLQGFKLTATAVSGVDVTYCTAVYLQYLDILGSTGTVAGVSFSYSKGAVFSCEISNRDEAIRLLNVSHILSQICSGSGNVIGLYASLGSVIAKKGGQPAGTTAELTADGGVIR